MRRWGALVVAVGLVGLAPQAVQAEDPPPCHEESWTGGTTEWCNGSLVYRDHVYDDYGADTGSTSPHGTDFSKPAGDVDATQHGQAHNSADLLTLRLRADGDELVVRFELSTLFPTDATIGAIALETQDGVGGGSWLDATGVDIASDGWDVAYGFGAAGDDHVDNVIEGRVPLPAGDFRIQAVVAYGDGTPTNVAFRPADHGNWFDEAQAAALAAGDISEFGHAVDRDALVSGDHHAPAPPTGPGYWQRMFRSPYTIDVGEGVTYEGIDNGRGATFHFLGAVQPYMVFVPEPSPTGDPYQAMLLLHGAGSGHNVVINHENTQRVLGTELNRILISPLSRGWSNSYVEQGAADALQALADVEAHWPVDADRRFVSGYSMGGAGTLQLTTWFPDMWAGAIDWVGFTGDCLQGTPLAQGRQRLPGADALADQHHHFTNDASQRSGCPLGSRANSIDYLENLRHVPSAHLFAGADELVWANHALGMQQRLAEAEVPHALWFHPAAEHFTFAVLADWRKEAAYTKDLVRVRQPARVTYRTNAWLAQPEFGIVPDGAYWVDDIVPLDTSATPAGDAVVDLLSHACSTGAEDTLELSQDAGIDPVPWIGQLGELTTPAQLSGQPAITGTLTNVASLTIDRSDACIAPGVTVDLSGIDAGGAVITVVD